LKSKLVISVLSVLLIGSNAWWAYAILDNGISYTHLKSSYEDMSELSEQLNAVVQLLTKSSPTKSDVLAAATRSSKTTMSYEKLGYTWIGQLGLKFDQQGRLVHVITNEDEAQ
jgi:uncharacterized membrane protein